MLEVPDVPTSSRRADRLSRVQACHPYYDEGSEQPGREHVGICGLGLQCGDETVPADSVCDGADDCEDGSDERDC